MSVLDRVSARWPRLDAATYAAFAACCILYAAARFYGSLLVQTRGQWSAPLDDVFIHFDYARATARGFPFEWSEGNGFSSGNTSLTYPFVLAVGYLAGFRGPALMQWAAIVACVSLLVCLVAIGRAVDATCAASGARSGCWIKYLVPPAVLSLGALGWSLFSGMENAFHLGVWGVALAATLAAARAAGTPAAGRRAWLAGAALGFLAATRPESVVCTAASAAAIGWAAKRRSGGAAAIAAAARAAAPTAIVLLAQAAANRALTGEWSQAGAIAKLALNNPYMTTEEKWNEYAFHLRYVVARLADHHFADRPPWGRLVPALAAVPLASRRLRSLALLLWAQVVGWLALVALNGQVRWQNERYTMVAVAWLLALAAMGVATLASAPGRTRGARIAWAARVAAAAALAVVYWRHQLPNVRDQLWFFGRASRNILDQHMRAGALLAHLEPRRVLVGDAGALLYVADRPGLDLIGLGGYRDFPFARAGVHGLGASIELIERMPESQRPDVMAIYPSWWGDLPGLFGRRIAGVPVMGNVICGGAEKVLYRADWAPLDRSGTPRTLGSGERIVDALDVADLISEREHDYRFPRPRMGYVALRVLADPADERRDLFDAGRVIPRGQQETARVRAPRGPGRLVVRTASTRPNRIEVRADGRPIGVVAVKPARGWVEASIDLPAGLPERFELALAPLDGDWVDHHVWILGP